MNCNNTNADLAHLDKSPISIQKLIDPHSKDIDSQSTLPRIKLPVYSNKKRAERNRPESLVLGVKY